ncbi:acyl-CoA thioesterase [Gaoshiqia sediminis]|uniref:Acyl-CoA thioesterase n=1 Tax=Gaoshiqia sediminis TaxID=2986998 RepID=A0AA41Y9D6_9BACT|nr:thioesterase family protein [Gaoshiqia sediminis]MCW0484335.1 acyl-CoA thioesterase [Gaoshiqia sediminis]
MNENNQIVGIFKLRPRYGEVDRMGYVYHANYVSYCHQARTELLRQFGIDDNTLESHNIMLPVISMNLRYLKPACYDELLSIKTTISEMPSTRFSFHFEIRNETGERICTAESSVVFVDSHSRKPMRVPDFVIQALENHLTKQYAETNCIN